LGTITPLILFVLQSNTFSGLFDGQNVITLQRTPSTNEYLKNELTKSTPLREGTVIMAVDQYAGRGQKGAVWVSEPGKNLTFSLLLTPTFLHPRHQFLLTVAISVAIAKCLETLLPEPVKIKWPNDLFVGDRKIGGILIENILKGNVWKSAIVGIGINVNQTAFPTDIARHTSSIYHLLHQETDLLTLLHDLGRHIEQAYNELKQSAHENLLAYYRQHLYRLNERHPFLVEGIRVHGTVTGVTENGRLQVTFDGHMADFDIKEIAFVI